MWGYVLLGLGIVLLFRIACVQSNVPRIEQRGFDADYGCLGITVLVSLALVIAGIIIIIVNW